MYYFALLAIAIYMLVRIYQVAREGKKIEPSLLDEAFGKLEKRLLRMFKK